MKYALTFRAHKTYAFTWDLYQNVMASIKEGHVIAEDSDSEKETQSF